MEKEISSTVSHKSKVLGALYFVSGILLLFNVVIDLIFNFSITLSEHWFSTLWLVFLGYQLIKESKRPEHLYNSLFKNIQNNNSNKVVIGLPIRILLFLMGVLFSVILIGSTISRFSSGELFEPGYLAVALFICFLAIAAFRFSLRTVINPDYTGDERTKSSKLTLVLLYSVVFTVSLVVLGLLYAILMSIENLQIYVTILSLVFVGVLLKKLIIDNRENFNTAEKTKAIFKAFIYWVPLSVFLVPGLLVSNGLNNYASDLNQQIITAIESGSTDYIFDPQELECNYSISCHFNFFNIGKKRINNEYRLRRLEPDELKAFMQSDRHASVIFGLIGQILAILTFIVIIKSYLVTLSRLLINSKNKLSATLSNSKAISNTGNILLLGKSFQLEYIDGSPEEYYVSRNFNPSGAIPMVDLPQPLCSTFRRLFSHALLFNKLNLKNQRLPIEYTSTAGAEFISWELAEGEELIFNYKNLVAFSTNVKLNSLVSLNPRAIILGSMVYSSATGPGKVILKTVGKPQSFKDGSEASNVPLNRIIAWNRQMQFDVLSSQRALDIYLSSVTLKPTSQCGIVIDSDTNQNSNKGIFSFAKQLLTPW
jgi:hypothetical protein